uniref:Multivesicular body subunit 12A n=2 Tax=Iconisemion striatum TaxID=60296 RepID=A0A1A7WE69_9TELE
MEHVTVRPVTGVAWTSNSGTCPKTFTLISITEDGATANFIRGFAIKSGYYLCYNKDLTDGKVVSDIQIISDKDSIPPGYFAITEYLEPKTSVSKKKRVCVRYSPVSSVDTAVLDIKLTSKSKMMLQHYTYVGDVSGYVLWCRKGQFTNSVPQPKPRNVGLDMRKLSLDQPDIPPALPLRHSNPPPPQTLPQSRLSRRRGSLPSEDHLDKSGDSSISGVTALDGVPFILHPDYDFHAKGTSLQLNSSLSNIRVKSLADIENEYNYTFAVEESAAKRTKPYVSAEAASTAP